MATLDEIRLKLISTDNMIKGVRLGIGITQSSQLQNIESVLKLISADIQDVLNSFDEYMKEMEEAAIEEQEEPVEKSIEKPVEESVEESVEEPPKVSKKK